MPSFKLLLIFGFSLFSIESKCAELLWIIHWFEKHGHRGLMGQLNRSSHTLRSQSLPGKPMLKRDWGLLSPDFLFTLKYPLHLFNIYDGLFRRNFRINSALPTLSYSFRFLFAVLSHSRAPLNPSFRTLHTDRLDTLSSHSDSATFQRVHGRWQVQRNDQRTSCFMVKSWRGRIDWRAIWLGFL